jgi:hypothetical protein
MQRKTTFFLHIQLIAFVYAKNYLLLFIHMDVSSLLVLFKETTRYELAAIVSSIEDHCTAHRREMTNNMAEAVRRSSRCRCRRQHCPPLTSMPMPVAATNRCATEPQCQCHRIHKPPPVSPLTMPRLTPIRPDNHDAAEDTVGAEYTRWSPPLTRSPPDGQPLAAESQFNFRTARRQGTLNLEKKA